VSYWLVLIAMILNGMINISIYSSCFEYAAAITPGIGEAASSGLINCLANVLGFLEIFGFEMHRVKDPKSKLDHWMFLMFFAVAVSAILQVLAKSPDTSSPPAHSDLANASDILGDEMNEVK